MTRRKRKPRLFKLYKAVTKCKGRPARLKTVLATSFKDARRKLKKRGGKTMRILSLSLDIYSQMGARYYANGRTAREATEHRWDPKKKRYVKDTEFGARSYRKR